jgi:hypothetical protein
MEEIHKALNQLMTACGLSGESGTEKLFMVLSDAVKAAEVKWGVVEQSHEEGLCYDVNALLADEMVKALAEMDRRMGKIASNQKAPPELRARAAAALAERGKQ